LDKSGLDLFGSVFGAMPKRIIETYRLGRYCLFQEAGDASDCRMSELGFVGFRDCYKSNKKSLCKLRSTDKVLKLVSWKNN
jgi:hypothetical protein